MRDKGDAIDAVLSAWRFKQHSLEAHPVLNRRRIAAMRSHIQALEEGDRDVTNTSITRRTTVGAQPDKNNYTNYAKQVEAAYKMYDAQTDYGAELLGTVADSRVAFIAGEGISYTCKDKKKSAFIADLLEDNGLDGATLLDAVLMGELEGRALLSLSVEKEGDEAKVKVRLFSWYKNKYTVKRSTDDYTKIESIKYRPSKAGGEVDISLENSIYVRLAGADYTRDETPSKICKVLTQIENASRATYDLRKNSHIFAKIFPYWKTSDPAAAKSIMKELDSRSYEIGDGYAGPAEMSLIEPAGRACDSLIKDHLASLRYVSSTTGIPIHWMSWPELMSNRATAENMLEEVSAATKRERLLWQSALRRLIDRACELGADAGLEVGKLDAEVDVRLPLISLAALKQVIEVWEPLVKDSYISRFTFMNMLPGIDPEEEQKRIDEEKEERAEESPLQNAAAQAALAALREGEDEPAPAGDQPSASPAPPAPKKKVR